MYYYFKVDSDNIVTSFIESNEQLSLLDYKETKESNIIGKRWNGKTFEEVPTEEVEVPETTEVTNADLLEVLLAIGEKVGM